MTGSEKQKEIIPKEQTASNVVINTFLNANKNTPEKHMVQLKLDVKDDEYRVKTARVVPTKSDEKIEKSL